MHNKFECNLSAVLKLVEEQRPAFNAVQEKIGTGIALFGAGQFGRASLEYLKKHNFKVVCFIDNAPDKQGTLVDGVPVVSSGNATAAAAGVILVTARHAVGQILASLQMTAPKLPFDAWFLMENLQKYLDMREQLFSDPRSKECLDGIMLTMLTGDERYCAAIMDSNQYFCLPQFMNTGKESFVDAGAYVGDSVERFIWANNGVFKHIYAFEPCGPQMAALRHRRERLIQEWALDGDSFTAINAGVGQVDSLGSMHSADGGLTSTTLHYDHLSSETQIVSLDSFIKDKPVTFIKADIEGMEMDMLRGAINTIKTNKPKMALCVYHKPDDLLRIAHFVFNIDKNYSFALRHHSSLLMETTLYCWQTY